MEARNIRIFAASPGDVKPERDILAGVINDLKYTFNVIEPDRHIDIEYLRWETNAYPAAGRPQALITQQIGPYDIFVGIMWRRFGTPSGAAGSGTEEEFNVAYRRWTRKRSPHIMFYFSNAPAPPPQDLEELKQLACVVRFRERIAGKALTFPYDDPAKFADLVRRNLMAVIAKIRPAARRPKAMISRERKRSRGRSAPARIVAISSDDAYYPARKRLIGRKVRLQNVQPTSDGWYGGLVELVEPHRGEVAVVPLFRFKFERR